MNERVLECVMTSTDVEGNNSAFTKIHKDDNPMRSDKNSKSPMDVYKKTVEVVMKGEA